MHLPDAGDVSLMGLGSGFYLLRVSAEGLLGPDGAPCDEACIAMPTLL